jgi:hypothetical protein
MLRGLWLFPVAALLLMPALAWAEDGYKIELKMEPVQGETDRVVVEATDDSSITLKGAGGKVASETKQKVTRLFQYGEETLEKEPGAQATRVRRQYEKAQETKDGKTTDLPYQGKTVLIEKKNDQYHFRIEGGQELTGKDAESLSREFGSHTSFRVDTPAFGRALPRKAVAAGASWKPDLEAVSKDLAQGGIEVDVARATGSGKLGKVYQKDGHPFGVMELELELPVQAINFGAQRIVMAPNSRLSLAVKLDGCIDGRLRDLKIETKLVLAAADREGNKLTIDNQSGETRSVQELSIKPGEKGDKKDNGVSGREAPAPSLADDRKALAGEWRRPADKGPYLRLHLLLEKGMPWFVDLGFRVEVHPDPEAKTKQVPQLGTGTVLKKEQGKRFLSLGNNNKIAYQLKGGKLILEGKTPSLGTDPKDVFFKGLDLSGEWEKVEPPKKDEKK